MNVSPPQPPNSPHRRRRGSDMFGGYEPSCLSAARRTPRGVDCSPAELTVRGVNASTYPNRHSEATMGDDCDKPNQDYPFRYDDGLSARLGVKRCPLIMRQHTMDGSFPWRLPPSPLEKPLRTKRVELQPWWPPVERSPVVYEKPAPNPKYIGLHCDYTRCVPNETVLRNF